MTASVLDLPDEIIFDILEAGALGAGDALALRAVCGRNVWSKES